MCGDVAVILDASCSVAPPDHMHCTGRVKVWCARCQLRKEISQPLTSSEDSGGKGERHCTVYSALAEEIPVVVAMPRVCKVGERGQHMAVGDQGAECILCSYYDLCINAFRTAINCKCLELQLTRRDHDRPTIGGLR